MYNHFAEVQDGYFFAIICRMCTKKEVKICEVCAHFEAST